MHFESFPIHFPEIAAEEIRIITFLRKGQLPIGSYAFINSYCADKECDCRRTFITVFKKKGETFKQGPLATISYGWKTLSFMKNGLAAYQMIF